jgi:hypothetical protein
VSGGRFARPVTLTDVGHRALPVAASYIAEWTGQPAVLTDRASYPVSARCKICSRRIRLGEFFQIEWAHVAGPVLEPVAAPSTRVNPGRGEPATGECPPAAGGRAAAVDR